MNWKTILSSVRKLPVKRILLVILHGRFIRSRQERSGWHISMIIPMHCFAVCV